MIDYSSKQDAIGRELCSLGEGFVVLQLMQAGVDAVLG